MPFVNQLGCEMFAEAPLRPLVPAGRRVVQGKETDPLWVPPDWHYYEKASQRGLTPVHIERGQQYPLSDGTFLEVRLRLEEKTEAHRGVADLAGLALGWTDGSSILIDANAAGFGWNHGTVVQAGRMDLFSTIVHEFGHLLGREEVVPHHLRDVRIVDRDEQAVVVGRLAGEVGARMHVLHLGEAARGRRPRPAASARARSASSPAPRVG